MHKFLGRQKIINPLGHKTILRPSAEGWFCVLRWNNQNHIKIEKSSVKFKDKINAGFSDFSEYTDVNLFAGLHFKHGTQVGSMFWLVSCESAIYNPTESHSIIIKSSTMLWFSNKQRWKRGPDLPLSPETFTNFCSSSLNSTAILFVFIGNTQILVTNVAIFNFQYKLWTDIPTMKEKLQDASLTISTLCTMATLFDKQTRPRVVVVFNQFVFDRIYVSKHSGA